MRGIFQLANEESSKTIVRIDEGEVDATNQQFRASASRAVVSSGVQVFLKFFLREIKRMIVKWLANIYIKTKSKISYDRRTRPVWATSRSMFKPFPD